MLKYGLIATLLALSLTIASCTPKTAEAPKKQDRVEVVAPVKSTLTLEKLAARVASLERSRAAANKARAAAGQPAL